MMKRFLEVVLVAIAFLSLLSGAMLQTYWPFVVGLVAAAGLCVVSRTS